jgi:hypothetical protein
MEENGKRESVKLKRHTSDSTILDKQPNLISASTSMLSFFDEASTSSTSTSTPVKIIAKPISKKRSASNAPKSQTPHQKRTSHLASFNNETEKPVKEISMHIEQPRRRNPPRKKKI